MNTLFSFFQKIQRASDFHFKYGFFLLIIFHAFGSNASNLNSYLGYSPHEKLLIIQIDDLGNFDSTTRAAQQISEFGLAQSGSLMTSAPQSQSAAFVLQSKMDLGVHLTLSTEYESRPWQPAATATDIPSLVDRSGNFQTLMKQILFADSTEVEKEMEAQILKAYDLGVQPTFLNSHMGSAFFKPAWFRSYLKLAKKYKLVPFIPRMNQGAHHLLGSMNSVVTPLLKRYFDLAEAKGFLLVDDFYILPPPQEVISREERNEQYKKIVQNLKPGVSVIILHPSFADFDFKVGVLSRDLSQIFRDHEAQLLLDTEFKDLLTQEGIRLISWKDLHRVYPWHRVED